LSPGMDGDARRLEQLDACSLSFRRKIVWCCATKVKVALALAPAQCQPPGQSLPR
jgi:hypothetical protein